MVQTKNEKKKGIDVWGGRLLILLNNEKENKNERM